MNGFDGLEVYQQAREFRRSISELTRGFPAEEKYRLVDQMIRASRSVTNQIAEGYGRYNYQESSQFCRVARGSLYELQDHLNIALDEKYIDPSVHSEFLERTKRLAQMLNGYIRFLQNKKRKS